MSFRLSLFLLLLVLAVPVALAEPPRRFRVTGVECLPLQPQLLETDKAAAKPDPIVEKFLRSHQGGEVTEYDLLRRPTSPLPLRRVVPEWERARFLVIAVTPQTFMSSRPEIADSFLQIIQNGVEVTDVLVLIHENALGSMRMLFQLLENNHLEDRVISAVNPANNRKKQASAATGGSIYLLPLAVNTYWARDYGPVFGETTTGGLCVLDAIYRDIRAEQGQGKEILGLYAPNALQRLSDDQVPTVLASLLTNRYLAESMAIVRPPLQLWGGDIFADGKGNGFTSTHTLVMNGGVKDEMNVLFREYYGMNHVTYLEPLPGDTIKHIDMFFHPVDESTFIVAEYPTDVPSSLPVLDLLHKEAQAVLERNVALLKKNFPNSKVLRVPMPPLSFPKDRRDMTESSLDGLKNIALEPADWALLGQNESASGEFDDLVLELAFQHAGKIDKATSTRSAFMRSQVLERKIFSEGSADEIVADLLLLDDKIKALEAKYPLSLADRDKLLKLKLEYRTLSDEFSLRGKYKTYMNFVHLKGDSREKVLVPSYRRFRNLEPEVLKVFQTAYPKAEIAFIPADELSEQSGAIHCVTCVVPDLRPRPGNSPNK